MLLTEGSIDELKAIMRIRIISATPEDADTFNRKCKLGLSLPRLNYDPRIVPTIAFRNSHGLPTVYNRAIHESEQDDVLLFAHDDIFIDDFNLFVRLQDALQAFDVIGLAGNVSPDSRHVSWIFWQDTCNKRNYYDQRLLSGVVAHAEPNGLVVCGYGLTPRQCVLLDGCFLAARAQTLRKHGVFFDEQFKFHFYDLDFCMTCRLRGLRLGTWPIAVTHASVGSYGSADWQAALKIYRQKWQNDPDRREPDRS
jgi:GT2 family glycosyltransferase